MEQDESAGKENETPVLREVDQFLQIEGVVALGSVTRFGNERFNDLVDCLRDGHHFAIRGDKKLRAPPTAGLHAGMLVCGARRAKTTWQRELGSPRPTIVRSTGDARPRHGATFGAPQR